MIDTIIAYRTNGGKVEIVPDDEGDPFVFSDHEKAVEYAQANGLFQSGQAVYQIIVLDEL